MIAVALDMDGTLIDLPVDIEPARRRVSALFAERGYHRDRFAPILVAIEQAAAEVACSAASRRQLVQTARAFIDEAEVAAAGSAIACPGARDLVDRLVGSGRRLGLVTDNGRACIEPALSAAGFADVAWHPGARSSRDDVAMPKPDPEGLTRVARRLLSGGGTLYYVGDSVRDIGAGRAADELLDDIEVITIAVTGGRSTADELRAARPSQLITHLDEFSA